VSRHAKYQATSSCGDLPLCSGQVQVHVGLTVLPHSGVVVFEESPCLRGSSRTNFQVLVLVLVHESKSLTTTLAK